MNSISYRPPQGVGFAGAATEEFVDTLLTSEALQFTAKLEREFGERRRLLLKRRSERQMEFNIGKMPDFLPETEQIRSSYWRIASIPNHLLDRRVEGVGPPDKDTMMNMLNSDANSYVADFEDTNSPTWHNILYGHVNLRDYVQGALPLFSERRERQVSNHSTMLMMCPRGWHAEEKHVLIDGKPVSASLFDFGMFFFHNARKLFSQEAGPYLYLPKLESALEASLWNDVFLMAQDELGIPRGSIKATVIIETVPAAFEMNEILYALKDHCLGLACGRWNYIFSLIKKFRHHNEFVLPDRSRLSMMAHFLSSLSLLIIQTSHKRGAHAIGGMTVRYSLKNNGGLNEEILANIYADKEREVEDGYDGTWVMDPESVPIAKAAFDSRMSGPNQLHRKRSEMQVSPQDLLTVHRGEVTEQGFRKNISDALEYFAAWLNGKGVIVSKNLIEHAATAEISRAQLWQWFHHGNKSFGGQKAETDFFKRIAQEELQKIAAEHNGGARINNYTLAKKVLELLVLDKNFIDFFTTIGYQYFE